MKCISIYIFRYIYVHYKTMFPFFFSLSLSIFLHTLLPFAVIGMCIIFILIIAQFWTEMFDIVLQMNVSCSCTMPIMTEYLVDQEKYFYFIVLWINITICVQVIVLLAIGTMFITFFQHIYGMFKIARYKNKNIN